MYNRFNLNIPEFFGAASILVIFFAFVVLLLAVILWIFSSLGLMNLAKKNNIANPWLAFIPGGYSYIVGKLGYEVYSEDKNPTLTWVTLGLGIASFLLSDTDIVGLINLALLVLHGIAFYNMFKVLTKNYVVYTVFTVLTNSALGGVFLYALRDQVVESNENNDKTIEEAEVVKENKDENEKKETKEEAKEETVEKEIKPLYCSSCGAKLNKNSKFCANCGKKVN